ncbi:hypothetical protein SD70_05855 [Gordoniibacillus kamchatkensis]|uniref:PPM-type phosphatase domain-containing protein n=1 Tax=Gordoniibacillus kamchatkensis TaxID=1590651 RepID=A0ABR5ALG1_9BACL|nr:protein phosphatase 2C domain-containing protein [Paenibacillus sp. VKM B-2647]KIL41643.1 hypothetical protein SD70_05855 [Paenibacillus sp. VKM B-2647]
MNIETVTRKGTSEWNEDALIVNEALSLYGVADGATSLRPYRGPQQETGGYLASRIVQRYLESLQAEDVAGIGLKELVVEANMRLREEMEAAGIDLSDKTALWTSALALIRIHEHYIDYAQVGDCMIAAVYADGTVRAVSRDQVAHIDYMAKRVWEDGIKNGVENREQLWELVKPTILANKSKMNTLHGYSVLSGELELDDLIEYGRINRIQLQSLLLVTDGLFLPKESISPATDSVQEIVPLVSEMTLQGYVDWLFAIEAKDKECRKYPRFKISDDKTGIWIYNL